MRALLISLLIVATCAGASAQAPVQSAPDVVVLKSGWSKERVGWEGDPFAGPIENFDQMRVRARNEKRMDDAKRSGSQSEYDRARREARADAAIIETMRGEEKPARYAFLYKVSFRNAGGRAVKTIDWDYVFLDAATGEELGRREFTSNEKIGPGKNKEISIFARTPPTRTISVHALNSKERNGLAERVEVVRVVYADGAVWESK